MNIKIKEIDNCVVLSMSGNLIEGLNTDEFNRIIRQKIESNKKNIIVDLSKIQYANSTGLSILFKGYQAVDKAGGNFRLVNLSSKLKNLLSITKLNTLFVVEENVETAIKNLD